MVPQAPGLSGQPAPERLEYAKTHTGTELKTQLTEAAGQRKLLKWPVPGAPHAAAFWGFIVLLLTIIEAYGALFSRTFSIPGIGQSAALGFIEDLFTTGVLFGIITFTVIRLRNNPHREGRKSRFFRSHTSAAWLVLGMIFLVIATLLIYRGAQENAGVFPYEKDGACPFASWVVGKALHPLGYGVNSVLEATFILLQLAVILSFLVFLTYSKHLHIVLAPLNVMFSRRPNGLGPLQPMRLGGKVLDFEEADPDTDVFGLGKIEDFSWKGLLDMGHEVLFDCAAVLSGGSAPVTNGQALDGHHRHENLLGAWMSVHGNDEPKSDSVIMVDLNAQAAAARPECETMEGWRYAGVTAA